jgi:hypothetical protein
MIGCYDFCGHYEWCFGWLERKGGGELVREYWKSAIAGDSQLPTRELIKREGFAGMNKYWGHVLNEESPDLGFTIKSQPGVFRIDIHDCPSKGFLIRNGLEQYRDYCDHCMGWIGPMMKEAGYVIDHEHNHCGQCWWEMRTAGTPPGHAPVGEVAGKNDVRHRPEWLRPDQPIDRYDKANDPDEKMK